MMQVSEQKKMIDQTFLCDLVLRAKQISRAAEEAQSFKRLCRQMGKQVCELSQMLNTLCCFITLNLTLLTHLNPIHCVITEVSNTLQEALTLTRTCKSKTIIIYRLFAGREVIRSQFHDLYDLLDFSIANMNWLLILYKPDFGSAFDDIFLSLPQTLSSNSFCELPTVSLVVTEKLVCKLSTMLKSGTSPVELKICCAEALSMLNVGSAISSRMIDQEKTVRELMLGLAKLVEAECGPEVQYNCLMSVTEITAAVESNPDGLGCKALKTNSLAAKAIVEQLLRVSKESENPTLQVLAIKSIGSLARIFREGDKHVIGVLVSQLVNRHQEVVMEALVALQKFSCGCGNLLGKAHSNTMIEFHAVQHMMTLLTDFERTEKLQHALVLICDLAMNADYSKVMEEARVRTFLQQLLTTKEGSFGSELKELVSKALWCLTLYYEC